MNLKCIKERCKYYVDFMKCKLTNNFIENQCVGIDKLEERKEEVGCKISKLTQEYEYLSFLKEWIKDNQE